MKLLTLCREPRLYSCQRLKAAAAERGWDMDILDPNRCQLLLQEGQLALYYQEGEAFCKNRPQPYRLQGYTGVLPRFGTASTQMGLNVLRHLEGQGIPALNGAQAFGLARDKWQSLQALVVAGLPVPSSALMGDLFNPAQGLEGLGEACVIKTLSGSQGVGVILSERPSSTASILDTLKQAQVDCLVQAFVEEAQGEDIRAFVVGGKVVAAMKRIGQAGDFRANIHQGGTAEALILSREEENIALRAAQAIGLDVAGVDLIRSHHGPMVLEVNASPGLEMIEQVSKVDIAGLMIEHLLQKID
ncbi:ribosomal protein S6 modification protein [Pasteurellaceae bacterium RH1A]|nr:ribosomal protein S6 modification protein [Pasteurellaceae bacterium RH1A]